MGNTNNHTTSRNCFTCQTRGQTEWCVLSDDELEMVNQGKSCREYLPGETIFHEGDPCGGVHCIEHGLVGIRKMNAGGDEILLRLSHPGDTMGYRSFLGGDAHNNSAEAMEPSVICSIDEATVRKLLSMNPSLGLRFLRHAAEDLNAAEEMALQSATLPVRARFAHLLLVLKDRYGQDGKNGEMTLELPLSRQDMAAMIGIRPESMSRTIRSFEESNVAHFSGRRVHVPNLSGLLDELEIPDGL
ncbi:MAG: Crp/Fnr family transcriptional regulator [Alphaproteobacteria bacterium]|nr:Crp/Fnr family transcriptional regulator [Alphaproteobacteria bacterium]